MNACFDGGDSNGMPDISGPIQPVPPVASAQAVRFNRLDRPALGASGSARLGERADGV